MKVQPLDLTRLRVFPLSERQSLTRAADILIDPDSQPKHCVWLKPSIVVGAGVIAIPPIGAAAIARLVVQQRASAVVIVSRPPAAKTDGYEAIAEAIMVVDEMVVIMAMPIASMPSSMGAIPTRTATPRTAGKSRPSHRPTDAARRKAGSTHTTGKVRSTHTTGKVRSTAEATATKASTTKAVGGVRLRNRRRGKEQAACKGGYCERYMPSHDASPGHRTRPPICSIIKKGDGLMSATRVKKSKRKQRTRGR